MADYERQRIRRLGLNLIPKRRNGREIVAAIATVICSTLLLYLVLLSLPGEECYTEYTTNSKFTRYNKSSKLAKTDYGSGLSTVALVFLSAVLGTLADRLCLAWEEHDHMATRYDGSKLKMLASCFSGIRWNTLILTATLAISVTFVISPTKEGIFATVLSGTIVVPLVVRLFNSNMQSQVEVSRILEEKEKSVANGLAWSYYFGYLEIILPGLRERIQQRHWDYRLSSQKLFILLPMDCNIRNDIEDADPRITREDDGDLEYVVKRGGLDRKYINKVHCIRFERERYRVLVEYAVGLDTLKKMSIPGRIKAIDEEERIDQVKLFCQTLQESILENPLNVECQGKCELVIYDAKTLEDQGNGLAGLLVERIEEVEGLGRVEEWDVREDVAPGDVQEDGEQQDVQEDGDRGNVRDNGEQENIRENGEQENAQEHCELRREGGLLRPMEETGLPGVTQ